MVDRLVTQTDPAEALFTAERARGRVLPLQALRRSDGNYLIDGLSSSDQAELGARLGGLCRGRKWWRRRIKQLADYNLQCYFSTESVRD
jgi:hypothetical protein